LKKTTAPTVNKVSPGPEKSVDFESQGEHNRSSAIEEKRLAPTAKQKVSQDGKKLLTSKAKAEHKRSSRLEKTTDGRREKLCAKRKKVGDLRNETGHNGSSR